MSVCLCVCVRERERDRETERKREREELGALNFQLKTKVENQKGSMEALKESLIACSFRGDIAVH